MVIEGKERFLKVYANLPIGMRTEIIAIVDGKPITWNVAFDEIEKETEAGKKVIKQLAERGMI